MSDTAAHLVDHVFPHVAVRQWVLTLPIPLRYRIAFDHKLESAVLALFLATVFAWLRAKANEDGILNPRPGAVTIIQRAGGSLNLAPHFHALVLDGVFSRPGPESPPVFHATPEPTDGDIADILLTVRLRVRRLLERRGLVGVQAGDVPDPLREEAPLLAACYGASVQGTLALGPRAGHYLSRVRSDAAPAPSGVAGARCARLDGYSLHADVRVSGHDRKRLEHLCRYIARPPLALERLHQRPDGRILYQLRRPWSDGTKSILFEPLDFMAKLAALVPHPRGHLVRFHGVLAPHAAWRPDIVPNPPAPNTPQPISSNTGTRPPASLPWAVLLARTFGLDVLTCSRCGGTRRLIAVITRPRVVRSILERLGLPPDPPPRAPARSPPQSPLDFPLPLPA